MKLRKTGLAICLAAALLLGSGLEAEAYYTEESSSSTYIYSKWGFQLASPDAYEFSRMVDLRTIDGVAIGRLADMCVTDEYIYLLDTSLGIIYRFDRQMRYVDSLKEFKMPDGSVSTLKKPEGIYISSKGTLYVADTENSRVLVSDWKGNVSLEVLKPENLVGTTLDSFLPTRVVADSAGRINVVARNINSGLMQFSSEGFFTGYTGAPSVSVDPFTKFLRKFYTDAQRAQMTTYVPTEYNNIKIDENNFIWGTISALAASDMVNVVSSQDTSGKITPIKKLNMKGSDVLARNGDFPPVGDLQWSSNPSRIVDVGLGPNDIYSMLDSSLGRIFTYNNNGIMLYTFGGNGTAKGETQTPIAIDYIGNNIFVLDSGLSCMMIFEPTLYGQLLIDAEGYYRDGNYEQANECWKQVTELNSNFSYPYVGLGNAEYNNGNYEDAMDYYEFADDRASYSNAKEKIRKDSMSVSFPYIVGGILILVALFIGKGIFVRVRRYVRGELVTYGGDGEE